MLSEHAIRQEQIALENRIGDIGYFVNEEGDLKEADTLWAKLHRSAESETRHDAAFFQHRFLSRTEERGGTFWHLVGVEPIEKPGTEKVLDMNRAVANTEFDPNWIKIDVRKTHSGG